ncbi:hypothetical protein [uncultured Gammaproteobacteria bacterium]|nr:hypothetical protein [uncultured Gammaproteobacteria bacterium]CAC9566453.1 hypothetical protein [uncultured Gammaproteobacteria bacterium]CAC9582460.1 hypothetical protein [uncultured Gammaproteobacteria bacterium]CAC9597214.1 hypothetical protein [uncultured Gammaproteobacteria bacterium]CAC9953410.1 hypothetical protein [uncultured Gammaproteobacteria bacterium]
MLLVGVCCREGFVTLPEAGCKHWEGLQTLNEWEKEGLISPTCENG